MIIREEKYDWASPLSHRPTTDYCVIHHEAGKGMTAQQIHQMHRDVNGWAGIGYHFYVRRDGNIYRGRPLDTIGTHTKSYNVNSVGVCFEGNFEGIDYITPVQKQVGIELLTMIKQTYPKVEFKRHKDLNATACPGKDFPFEEMTEEATEMALTGEQINTRAKEYRCSKDESDWSKREGAWKKATDKGIVNGKNPQDNITREELIAVLGRLGLLDK